MSLRTSLYSIIADIHPYFLYSFVTTPLLKLKPLISIWIHSSLCWLLTTCSWTFIYCISFFFRIVIGFGSIDQLLQLYNGDASSFYRGNALVWWQFNMTFLHWSQIETSSEIMYPHSDIFLIIWYDVMGSLFERDTSRVNDLNHPRNLREFSWPTVKTFFSEAGLPNFSGGIIMCEEISYTLWGSVGYTPDSLFLCTVNLILKLLIMLDTHILLKQKKVLIDESLKDL